MKNFKKAAIRLLAVCIAIALCNIPCVALGAEAVSVTAVTVVGANYTLPAKVNDVNVTWDTTAVNTSVAGNHYYTGTDANGNSVNLTLKVMETETIFSDDMESYPIGADATRPALDESGKGLYISSKTSSLYVDSEEENNYVKVLPNVTWGYGKFVIGSEAYMGDFEANMKLKVVNRQGETNYDLLQVRMSADDSTNSNMVGGFYLRNNRNASVYGEQEIDEVFVAGYNGTAAAISNTKLTNITTEKITDNNGEIGYTTEWINVKLVYNADALTYDIYINNDLIIRDTKMTQYGATTTGIRSIYFADRNKSGDVATYIDDVSVKKLVDIESYKTLIYEDMEKYDADTDATAGTATRPTLIRANTEATTETVGLEFSGFDSAKNDIYIKNIDGNNVIYNNGQTGWNNYLALPQAATGNFDVTARVKFDVEDITTGNFISLVAHDSVLDKSVGGVRLTYSTNLLAITYTQAGINDSSDKKNTKIGSYVSVTENGDRRVSDWIDIRLSFSSDKTYDIYINDNLVFGNATAYNGQDTTNKIPVVDQIKFACRGTDGTFVSMIDDIKVTVPVSNTSATGKQLLIAGDSIAAGYDLNADTRGWGQVIGDRLQNITVNNNAVAGQYTRGFFDNNVDGEGVKLNRFDELMWVANPGDILVLSFGHNERSRVTNNEYTIEDYKNYLGKFINKAKAYGVTTVLATSIAEAYFDGENVSESRDKYSVQINDFATAMKEFAAANNIPVIDLYAKTKNLLSTIGEDSADNYYVADKTHLLERGAKTVARYLTEGFAATPLAPYVRTDLVDGGVVMNASVADGITIVNNNDVNYPLSKLIKAEYTGTVLDTAAISDVSLEAGGTYNSPVTVNSGNTARVFLFESLDNLIPLTTSENVK